MLSILTANTQDIYINVFSAIMRYAVPALTLILLFRCIYPLVSFRREPEIWGWLCLTNGRKLPITHWENVVGRHKNSDIVIDFPTISKTHCVVTRYGDGSWSISDADSKDGVYVDGEKVDLKPIYPEDIISIGGVEMTLKPISQRQERRLAQLRSRSSSVFAGFANLMLLSVLQIFL